MISRLSNPREFRDLGIRPCNGWFDRVVSGAVAVGLNVVGGMAAACGTLGLAGPIAVPLAAASVAAGVVGVEHAATGGLTP